MDTVCSSCGAPAKPGVIVCEFCEHPYDAEAARRAIHCKRCQTLNVETAQQCMKCKDWLVVQCLFCSHLTRNDAPACARCNEPFAGAAERKAARDAQMKQQQMFQVAGAVAPIAGSLLGGVAGALLGNSWSSGPSSYGGHTPHHGGHSQHHSMGEGFRSDDSSSSSSSSSVFGDFFGGTDNEAREQFSGNNERSSSGDSEGGFFDSVAEAFSSDDDDNSRG